MHHIARYAAAECKNESGIKPLSAALPGARLEKRKSVEYKAKD
jgi:hypothetical protein